MSLTLYQRTIITALLSIRWDSNRYLLNSQAIHYV